MKRAALILSAFLISALILGCESAVEPPLPDGESKIETIRAEDAFDLAGFTILRSDLADKTVIDAAVELRKTLTEVCGVELSLSTDWVKRGESVPTDTAELIVGNSNRRAAEDLRRDDFKMIREGNRIYLLGGSSDAVKAAVDYFAANCLAPNGILLADGIDYIKRAEYDIEKLSFGSAQIDRINYYSVNTDKRHNSYAERMAALIGELTGFKVEKASNEKDANLVFTDRPHSDIPDGSWGTITEDGKLTLVGGDDIQCRKVSSYVAGMLASASGELAFGKGVYSEHQITREEYYEISQLVIYPEFPEQIVRDYTYSVSVTQSGRTETLPVYNHTMESTVSRNSDGADNYRRFSTFAFSGEPVRVDIKVNRDFSSYSVMPSAKGFKHEFKDGVISVYLDKPDYFLIRLDGSDNSIISVFADYPEFPDDIDKNDPDLIYIDGWYEPEDGTGLLKLTKPDTTLYIAPGAVLNARVTVTGENSRVLGRGAIVDPYEDIYNYDITFGGNEGKGSKMLTLGARDILADGIHILDARCFNVAITGDSVTARNLKLLSSMMTSDGISIYSGTGALAEHCFIYVGDNATVFSAKDTVYRDLTIGTTCAAVFPQGNPDNTLLEDIHIFRTDDGIINHTYNGDNPAAVHRTADVKIDRLDTVDCTYMPWLFQGRNMGNLAKVFDIRNVSMGDPSAQKTGNILRFLNSASYLETENYTIKLTNLALGDKVVGDISELKIEAQRAPKNECSCAAEGSFTPIAHDTERVDYRAPDKVFIGDRQIFFAEPVINDGGLKLPYDQLKAELRTEKTAAAAEKNGVKYVAADALVSSGMAKSAELREGALYIAPVYSGENLLLPDSGELSKFTEATCYELDLVTSSEDGKIVYTVINTKMTLNSGIQRLVNEELHKYGAGKYRLSYRVKGSEKGNLTTAVNFKNATALAKKMNVTDEWSEQSFDFTITDELLAEPKITFVIKGNTKAIESFSLSDITLTKLD